ncbi:hypothetical protein WJX84_000639 [Apatococcus fuscideae]|uniref:Uncharacterized protein n=1 Tax=Apatococcus fuscideae TaxID=2026836 RepID=A0AAW1T8T4_9CHLO
MGASKAALTPRQLPPLGSKHQQANVIADLVQAASSQHFVESHLLENSCNRPRFQDPCGLSGMSYLKYSGLAADMVRESMKEPFKSKAKLREAVYFKSALWKDGQQQQQVITDLTPPEAIQKK